MIDNTGWEYVRKYNGSGSTLRLSSTNVLYTPTLSPDKDKMCMHYIVDSEYLTGSCVPRTEELLQYWFERELKYLTICEGKSWCPEIYDIDYQNRKILIEFNRESLNIPIFDENRSFESEYPNWKNDLFNVILSISDMGYYKSSIYPHCFFYSHTGKLKMIDYYATIPINDSRIHKSIIEPIIGVDSEQRFIEVKDGDFFEMADHFKNSLKTWIKWPDDPLPQFYDEIFGSSVV